MKERSIRGASHAGQPVTYESRQISAKGGTRLMAYRWPALGTPKAGLLIVHGLAEHARRYAGFALQLARRGIEVHAFDLRGHGATTRSIDHGHIGDGADWATLIDDVQRLRSRALSDMGDAPVFVMGHSLGAFIVQGVLQHYPEDYAGAILSGVDAPNRWQCRLASGVARLECLRLESTHTSQTLQQLIFGPYDRRLGRYLGDSVRRNAWLSNDDAAVERYENDADCGFPLTAGSWHTILGGIARTCGGYARRRMRPSLALLLLAGGDDPMGRFGRGPERLARALRADGQHDLTLHLYEGMRHELLHDSVADTVTADIGSWIAARIPAVSATGRPATVS